MQCYFRDGTLALRRTRNEASCRLLSTLLGIRRPSGLSVWVSARAPWPFNPDTNALAGAGAENVTDIACAATHSPRSGTLAGRPRARRTASRCSGDRRSATCLAMDGIGIPSGDDLPTVWYAISPADSIWSKHSPARAKFGS